MKLIKKRKYHQEGWCQIEDLTLYPLLHFMSKIPPTAVVENPARGGGEGLTLPFGPETSGSKERVHPEGIHPEGISLDPALRPPP